MSSGPYSYETGIKKTFEIADYVVFGCTLAVSAAIGMFYAIKDRNRNTVDEYLLAGRRMHPLPVAMSLLSSFISAITILGTPSEVYIYGTMYWWISVAVGITAIGAAHIFIPVFYNLGITSVFEYIQMRFGVVTRVISSIVYLTWMMFYMAIVLYAPSLALNAVTGLSLWGSVIAVSLVCIFYTALGGMKAVLWADTVQMLIVFAGMITILVLGSNLLGGFDVAWDIADKHGRIVIFEFDPDPRLRHSVWNVVIGGGIFWCSVFGTNQAQVQRTLSVKSVRHAQFAVWLNFPGMASIITLSCVVGVVMFAFYAECDPVSIKLVDKADQMLPLYMMDILSHMPGLPGLLLSCIFSGSLSTMSSGLNAVAAVVLEDFVRPFCCKGISQGRATLLSKAIVILAGLFSLAFAFLVSQVGAMVLQLAYVLFGVFGGPLLGLFSLGILFPWANKWGGGIGISTAVMFLMWLGVGTSITGTSVVIKPGMSHSACNYNISDFSTTAAPTTIAQTASTAVQSTTHIYDKYDGIDRLYTVSYMWYSGIGVCIVVVVGLIVSLITGRTDPKTLNPKLICPFFDIFFPFLPEKIRKPLRFGVRHGEDWNGEDTKAEKKKERIASLTVNDEIRPYKIGKDERNGRDYATTNDENRPYRNDNLEQNGRDNIGYQSSTYDTRM